MNVINKRIIPFLLLVLMLVPVIVKGDDNRRVYMCSNCNLLTAMDRRPNSDGCSKGEYHTWADLGLIGTNVFFCQKCNTVVYTQLRPNGAYTKYGFHSWIRIGDYGKKVFSCKNCALTVHLSHNPSPNGCRTSNGGYHNWFELQ